jgi:hypothetical protein
MSIFTKDQISQIRKDLDAALAQVTAKHKVAFSIGTIRFDSRTMRCKLEGINQTVGVIGDMEDPTVGARDGILSFNLRNYGINKLPREFAFGNLYVCGSVGSAEIVGYNTRAHKYPFIVKQAKTGKRYRVSMVTARNAVQAGAVGKTI